MTMHRLLAASLLLLSVPAFAAEERKGHDAELTKKGSANPDKALAGDITRKKEDKNAAPVIQYDQFRLGVELQVASKRREQIASLKKIIGLSQDAKETPGLLFRLGELYWEESRAFFFEANRKDDELINAMNRNDAAGQARAKAEKADLVAKSKQYSQLAMDQYSEIVQKYRDFERSDEVLYFLGHNLMESGDDRKALVAYKRLVEKYPKSRYIADAHLAFGEYYFNNSKGKRDQLEKALDSYKKAAAFPESQVYAFALYKQGWCHYNMGDHRRAMDQFKAVILYGELAGTSDKGGKGVKSTLIKEARNDYVRAYAQIGSPQDARAEFGTVASNPDDRFTMLKQLANFWYGDGRDKEAAITYNALIKEKPLSPEAPGFQGRIVDCILRAGNKKMTVEQVRRLVKIMQDIQGSGVIKDDKDKKALAEARDLSERTLSNLAVTWHNEAKKTRDEETFELANEVYTDYLILFPENPKAYDLRFFQAELLNDNLSRFDKAAEGYTLVVMMDAKKLEGEKDADGKVKPGKPGKWLVNAAYNAVLANDELVKKAEASGQLKSETSTDATKKLKIPGPRQALLDACERYLKYVPNGDKRVEISFKAANVLYRYNHFDEAVQRFSDIALNHTDYKFENGERAAEMAANLVLDSYNLLGDWTKVNEWARKFFTNEKLAQGKFRDELAKVLEQSAFKLIGQLEEKQQFAKAAEAYLSFVNDFPKSEIADKALFNASIDFYKGAMVERALQVRSKIVAEYPRSEFVPDCIYLNAEAHELIGDFEDAANGYEAYVTAFERSRSDKGSQSARGGAKKGKKGKNDDAPQKTVVQKWDEKKAQVALFNAAVFREGLGQLKQALRDRERYLELWPDAKDAEAVFLSIADLHEKNGAYAKAVGHLEDYERKYKDANKVLAAEGRIALLFEQKIRRQKDATRIFGRILKYYEELPSRTKKSLENAALDAVARAHYLRNEEDFRFYANYKVRWGRLPSPEKAFKEGVQEKLKRMKVVENDYTQTVALKAGEPAVCALYKLGLTSDNFVETLVNAPMPASFTPELQDAVREGVANEVNPLKEKAAEAFAAAVQKGRELNIQNDCVAKSLQKLRETYRPDQYPPPLEEVVELKAVKPPARGSDLLVTVRPIPILTEEEKVQAKENAEALKDDLVGLGNAKAAEPERRSGEPEQKAAPAEKGKDGKDPKKKNQSDEPEDFLQ
ncbi:MAG TPA: tetratricopeptide repeat protein [Myxococcaceae bacterium]|nr:tetratricopeptide repeat protein [Myxococcaceae bacterium]